MTMINNVKYTKNDLSEQLNELNNEIDFLIYHNFKMYLQNKNITNLNNYERYLSIFSDNYKKYIIKNGGYLYKAELNDEIIGILYINKNNYIDSLFIKEEYQNNQIGSNLLKIVLSDYINESITLTCNINTLNFYKKLGFTETNQDNSKNKESYQLIYKNLFF